MSSTHRMLLAAATLAFSGSALAQGAILDMVAQKVIQKYQNATCEQLWEMKGQPKSPEEQQAIQYLQQNPAAATDFINQVAGPIVNKMFQCGMVP